MQPRVGIGDMIWHLPHIRALARQAGGRVTLVTRSRSKASEFVGAEDGIDDFFWVEQGKWTVQGRHEGVLGMARLIADLRARRFDAAVLLTRSRMLALAVAAAGVPQRWGYGIGRQRWLLNRPPRLDPAAYQAHAFDQAGTWLRAAGIEQTEVEPRLHTTPAAREQARARLGVGAAAFVALGIGASPLAEWKKWGASHFAELAGVLLTAGWPVLVLVGGEAESADADAICALVPPHLGLRVRRVLGWDLRDTAALLQQAAFYVGNDTSALNIAAAVGVRAYGLFGGTPVLRHSRDIVAVLPSGGPPDEPTGMSRIGVGAVLDVLRTDRGGLGPA